MNAAILSTHATRSIPRPETHGAGEMERILVAYDGTPPARRALETAVHMAERFGASISVVSVVPRRPGVPVDPKQELRIHDDQLEEARRVVGARGLTAETIEPIGDPGTAIERIARIGRFDTIVVGSRRLGAVSRLVRGSVSRHLATHAHVTVVVVP
ncbi:MAG TPA: universal stress protein [Candidatus Limnocylindrales bacterium]|jgi:nucleotide-binding universal stress UspA family protein